MDGDCWDFYVGIGIVNYEIFFDLGVLILVLNVI